MSSLLRVVNHRSSAANRSPPPLCLQVSLNVNFALRNLVQAVGTLCFMFYVSWKLRSGDRGVFKATICFS